MKRFLLLTVAYAGSVFGDDAQPSDMQPPDMSAPDRSITLGDRDYSFVTKFMGLALKPSANNLDYGAEATPFDYGEARSVLSPTWTIPEISTDYHFGFDAGIAGIFHTAGSSLSLNWEHFHSSTDSNTFTVSSTSFMFGPFF